MVKFSLLVVPAIFLCATQIAQSCTCIEPRGSLSEKVRANAAAAAYVAIVRVTSIKFVIEERDEKGRYLGLGEATVPPINPDEWLLASYEAVHVWKQSKEPKPEVATGLSEAACGLPFKVGQTVLIYAYAPDYTGLMHADSCGRSNLLERALGDVAILNKRYRTKRYSLRLLPN